MSNQYVHLTEVDSTNDYAKRMAEAGEANPHWIYADTQTAGRGRRGREWVSPIGNLMATLYLPCQLPSIRGGEVAFVAGLAIDACVQDLLTGTAHVVAIKYPNDILVNGAKISGMLLETTTSPSAGAGNLDWIAIGIGINLAHHPEDTPYPATSIAALIGNTPPPKDVLVQLADYFTQYFTLWQDKGIAAILEMWRKRAHHIGKPIEVRLHDKTISGTFESIDDTGTLILREAGGGCQHINTGDIFFPSPKNDEAK